MPTDLRYLSPRTYRLSSETLVAIAELGRLVRPGVELSDRQVIEAVVLDRIKAERRKAMRLAK
jgi:hypothetical protein